MRKTGMCLKTAVLMLSIIIISTVSMFAQKKINLKTKIDSISYSIGINIGKNLMQGDIKIDPEIMKIGFTDAFSGAQQITDDEIMNAMVSLNQQMQENMEVKAKKKGSEFLEVNKKKPNVKVTPSGLQYEVVNKGSGEKPRAIDTVKVHYTGKLLDGKVFDSSVERDEPVEFPLNRVIPGWTEGLQLMSKGAKYILYLPYDLAYGEHGAPPDIGPYETLIFEVELIDIKKATESSTTGE